MRKSNTIVNLPALALCAFVMFAMTSSALADDLAKGKEIYNGIGGCAGCHGTLGKGDGPAGGTMDPKPLDFTKGTYKFDTDKDGKKGTEADIINVIVNGASKYGGSFMMVARADIAEADRIALAKYVLSLKE